MKSPYFSNTFRDEEIVGKKEIRVSPIGIFNQLPQCCIDRSELIFAISLVDDAEFAIPVAAASPIDGQITPSFFQEFNQGQIRIGQLIQIVNWLTLSGKDVCAVIVKKADALYLR